MSPPSTATHILHSSSSIGSRASSTGGVIAAASGSGGIAAAVVTIIGRPLPTISETTTAFTTVSSTNSSPEKTSFANGLEPDPPTATDCGVGECIVYQIILEKVSLALLQLHHTSFSWFSLGNHLVMQHD